KQFDDLHRESLYHPPIQKTHTSPLYVFYFLFSYGLAVLKSGTFYLLTQIQIRPLYEHHHLQNDFATWTYSLDQNHSHSHKVQNKHRQKWSFFLPLSLLKLRINAGLLISKNQLFPYPYMVQMQSSLNGLASYVYLRSRLSVILF